MVIQSDLCNQIDSCRFGFAADLNRACMETSRLPTCQWLPKLLYGKSNVTLPLADKYFSFWAREDRLHPFYANKHAYNLVQLATKDYASQSWRASRTSLQKDNLIKIRVEDGLRLMCAFPLHPLGQIAQSRSLSTPKVFLASQQRLKYRGDISFHASQTMELGNAAIIQTTYSSPPSTIGSFGSLSTNLPHPCYLPSPSVPSSFEVTLLPQKSSDRP